MKVPDPNHPKGFIMMKKLNNYPADECYLPDRFRKTRSHTEQATTWLSRQLSILQTFGSQWWAKTQEEE